MKRGARKLNEREYNEVVRKEGGNERERKTAESEGRKKP